MTEKISKSTEILSETVVSPLGSESSPHTEDALWSISAVSQMTRLTQHTLRIWERRFGFPVPVRLPSGHRRFTPTQVEHLQLIAKALRQGHRAGDIVPLPLPKLKELLSLGESGQDHTKPPTSWHEGILEKAKNFDRKAIADELRYSAVNLGIRTFLRDRIVPLLDTLGDAWRDGRIDVRHEHFVSELIEDTLRNLRIQLEPHITGTPVLLTTLPQELHGLGLQMAALTIALCGRQLRILGVNTPLLDIIAATNRLKPAAVGISVSVHSASRPTSLQINQLRQEFPSFVKLWIGGAGATFLEDLVSGIVIVRTLDDLERMLKTLEP